MAAPSPLEKSRQLKVTIPQGVREITFTFGPPDKPDQQVLSVQSDRRLQQDPLFNNLLWAMTSTAAEILNHNLLSSVDATNTPYEVELAIRQLRQISTAIYNRECARLKNEQKGLRSAFALFRAARIQVFIQEPQISDLPNGSKEVLTERLRWHIEDALKNPQQFASGN